MEHYKDNILICLKLLLPIILFLIGGAIYLLYRDKSLLLFRWFDFLGLSKDIDRYRNVAIQFPVSDFVKYSLPDGLWISSYILSMNLIWKKEGLSTKLYWISSLPIIAILSELLQYCHIAPGTFDIYDLICYTISFITYLIYLYYE